jgi:putative methyltransferase (TIGR04325 family)
VTDARALAKRMLPPALVDAGRRVGLFGAREWEYVSSEWASPDARVAGWDVQSVVDAQVAKWPAFLKFVDQTGPLGIAHEALSPTSTDQGAHNTVVSYGYVLARAAHGKDTLSVLDWGGGLGHYYVFSTALLPGVEFDYTCKDLPRICAAGHVLLPAISFCDDDSCLSREYDLVHAGTSLHYSQDWRDTAARLARAAAAYLYVSRLPVVSSSQRFVVVQRPYRYGYGTEYLCWFLNRAEFVEHIRSCGFELAREFLVADRPYVFGAPEQGEFRSYLFRRSQA